MKRKIFNEVNIISFITSFIAAVFMSLYVFNTSVDVVVSDYMRIINYYYDNVFDLHYLFSIEAISRTPISFLIRIINALFFNLSVSFDRSLNILFLFLFNFVLVKYVLTKINKKYLRIISSTILTTIVFSLSQWEMILNGTAYPHYMTLFMIITTFYYFDKYFYSNEYINKYDDKILNKKNITVIIFILITSIIFAGSYGVAFCMTFILMSIIMILINFKNKSYKSNINYYIIIIVSVVCILLFYISNTFGEPYEIAGAKNISLIELLKSEPLFVIKFFVKSLSSSMVSANVFEFYKYIFNMSERSIYFYGITYLLFIIIFVLLFVLNKSYKKYIFLVMTFALGIFDYLLIFLARYIFVKDTYGMSSRYYIQYMFVLISLVSYGFIMIDNLDLSLIKNKIVYFRYIFTKIFAIFFIVYLMSLQYISNKHEIMLMPYRKVAYEKAKNIIMNIDEYEESEIKNSLEYQKDISQILNAIDILKKRKYNVFK